MPNSKGALNLDSPLSSHCLVTEGVHYFEPNGSVEPDTIPTAIFPTDLGIIPETQAESTCNTPLMAS